MQQLEAQNRWLDTSSSEWTIELARELLSVIQDDRWKASAVVETRAADVEAQLALLEAAIESSTRYLATNASANAVQTSLASSSSSADDAVEQLDAEAQEAIRTHLELLELQDKAKTWRELRGSTSGASAIVETVEEPEVEEDVEASWQFDGDDDDSSDPVEDEDQAGSAFKPASSSNSLPSLPEFLDIPILQSALTAAAEADFVTLRGLFNRHAAKLSPHRLLILDRIPLFSEVADYTDILPQVDASNDTERMLPGTPWRTTSDPWEAGSVTALLDNKAQQGTSPRTAEQISQWYRKRVEGIDQITGRVDNCLALIQHGASQGVPSLDALGEELSLLTKLVYEKSGDNAEDWTLQRWNSASPSDIVAGYLSGSTPESVVSDIRRMALPYLFVLESQKERAGTPDPTLHGRLLDAWILSISASRLDLVASVFAASKPTLRPPQRIIRDDIQLVRLALAIAYSYAGTSSWETLTAIFDCLPALEENTAAEPSEQNLHSLLSRAHSTSTTLYADLGTWSQAALSRALDAFDLHLEAAEIFSRWSAPKPLSFFVTLSEDSKQQQMWADRLARTSASAVTGRGGGLGGDFEYEDEWISLLDDLCKLAGDGGNREDGAPKPVFGSLSQKEITRIFFSGLLSSGSTSNL